MEVVKVAENSYTEMCGDQNEQRTEEGTVRLWAWEWSALTAGGETVGRDWKRLCPAVSW